MQTQSNNENLECTEMPLLLIKSQQRELDSIHKTMRNAFTATQILCCQSFCITETTCLLPSRCCSTTMLLHKV